MISWCWSLLFGDLALSSSCSQASLGEWKSMLWSPRIISVSDTMATLFLSPLGNDRDGQRITLTAHWMAHSTYLIIELLLWCSHIFHEYFHLERSSHICLTQISLRPVFWSYAFQVPGRPTKQLYIARESVHNHIWQLLPPRKMYDCVCRSKLFSLWRKEIPLSVSFRVVTERCYNDISVCFWVVPACVQNKLENQVLVFYTSANWSLGTFHEVIDAYLEA